MGAAGGLYRIQHNEGGQRLLAEQRERLGIDALQPAEQIAELIREKAAVRERESLKLEAVLNAARAQ